MKKLFMQKCKNISVKAKKSPPRDLPRRGCDLEYKLLVEEFLKLVYFYSLLLH